MCLPQALQEPQSFSFSTLYFFANMAEATVKFNVGGKHFEVSRALVDGHANTVLVKLVSDTCNDDPSKAVFIDRSGDIFVHVLIFVTEGK